MRDEISCKSIRFEVIFGFKAEQLDDSSTREVFIGKQEDIKIAMTQSVEVLGRELFY